MLLTVLVMAGCGDRGRLPSPDTAAYERAVSHFDQGVTALQVGNASRAEAALQTAADAAPAEPAVWVNLGVLALRRRDFEAAAAHLENAREQASENAHVRYLQAILAREDRRLSDAAARAQEAVDRDADHGPARALLIRVLDEQGRDAEALQEAETLVRRQPSNPAALLIQARLAARGQALDPLRGAVDALDREAATWPDAVRSALDRLRAAVQEPNYDAAADAVGPLREQLLRMPGAQEAFRAVDPSVSRPAVVVRRVLRLQPPQATPAPRDSAMTLVRDTVTATPSTWSWGRMIALHGTLPATLVLANGRDVRVDRPRRADLEVPFPGGPQNAPPRHAGLAGVDVDGDADLDVVLAGEGGVRLYVLDDDTTLTDVTASALPPEVRTLQSAGVWDADLNGDGAQDLVVGRVEGAPVLLANQGDGTFTVTDLLAPPANVRKFQWGDVNGDGRPDAVFVTADADLALYWNRGDGNADGGAFERAETLDAGPVLDAALADVDADGRIDLLTLHPDGSVRAHAYGPVPPESIAPGATTSAPPEADADSAGSPPEAWATTRVVQWDGYPGSTRVGAPRLFTGDVDSNGSVDVVVATVSEARVWLSGPDRAFRRYETPIFAYLFGAETVRPNGRLDFVGRTARQHFVALSTRGTAGYRAFQLQVSAPRSEPAATPVNPLGVGSAVEVRAGLSYQGSVLTGPVTHFGLGSHPQAETMRIRWPNGTAQVDFEVPADTVAQVLYRSAP